jgi:hypothetical protein
MIPLLAGVEQITAPVPLQVAVYVAFAVGESVVVKPVAKDVALPSLNQSKVPTQFVAVRFTVSPIQISLSLTPIEGTRGGATTVIVEVDFAETQEPTVHVTSYVEVIEGLGLNVVPVASEVELPSKYQFTVPPQPEAVKVVDEPAHIVVAVGVIAGAVGVGLTFTTVETDGLLHTPLRQAA